MFKKIRKFTGCLLLAFVLFITTNTHALAAQPEIDTDRTGSIFLMIEGEKDARRSVEGTQFTLYQVGSLYKDSNKTAWVLTDAFSGSGASLSDLENKTLAEALADYARKQDLTGTTETVSEEGSVKFDNLQLGIYLLIYSDNSKVAIDPFLVSVPIKNTDPDADEQWIYDVDATPKPEVKIKTDVSVKKVWKDGDATGRPSSVTVTLYKGLDAVGSVDLSEKNNWSHTWKNLESGSYSVKENSLSGFTAAYTQDGYDFTVTNILTTNAPPQTSTSTSSSRKLAQTGQLNWPVPVLAGSGVLLFLVGWGMIFLKKKK